MIIFNLESIGLPSNAGTILLQYFVMLYNGITKTKSIYEANGNILGIKYTDEENKLNSQFEKLDFNEKLDIISEIIIRYDNETYFDKKITISSIFVVCALIFTFTFSIIQAKENRRGSNNKCTSSS